MSSVYVSVCLSASVYPGYMRAASHSPLIASAVIAASRSASIRRLSARLYFPRLDSPAPLQSASTSASSVNPCAHRICLRIGSSTCPLSPSSVLRLLSLLSVLSPLVSSLPRTSLRRLQSRLLLVLLVAGGLQDSLEFCMSA